jgi:hypothetical protein
MLQNLSELFLPRREGKRTGSPKLTGQFID